VGCIRRAGRQATLIPYSCTAYDSNPSHYALLVIELRASGRQMGPGPVVTGAHASPELNQGKGGDDVTRVSRSSRCDCAPEMAGAGAYA